ncbi:hypothetical protein [Exiguobacterium sp. USCH10]|jgi:nucleoside 2-deoxyribosyltransferase|uniref:hypothetical protein n=1 Tax=Exiguobacterium sp. USCH10 TaxID=3024839 RepID=UPI0030A9D1EF
MSTLTKKLIKYKEDKELLNLFRNAIENEITHLFIGLNHIERDILNARYSSQENQTPEEQLFNHQMEGRNFLYEILPFLNEFNLSIKEVTMYESEIWDDEGNFETTENLYDVRDIVELIRKMDDYLYFVAMVYLQQNANDHRHQMYPISIRVSTVLRQLGIKIPRYAKTIFIAMSFNPQLSEVRKSISDTVIRNGFKPLIIDSKEHTNQIVPEIFYEIENAEFVIADLTDHKNGVYYEAGYAKGIGKEVIFTCHTDDFEKRHFDVAQTNTIVWKNISELSDMLSNRIEAIYINE